MRGAGLSQSSRAGSVLLATSARAGAAMCEEVGSVSFHSALNINVTFCTMGQLSPKAWGCAGTLLHALCLE